MSDLLEEYYSEEAARRRANRKTLSEGVMAFHGVIWLVGSVLMLIAGVQNALIIGAVWFGLVALHGITMGVMESREKNLHEEIEMAAKKRVELGLKEKAKPKRSDRLVLSDEGEVLDVIESTQT